MTRRLLAHVLFVGVPGTAFVIFGALKGAYTLVVLGGILVADALWSLLRRDFVTLRRGDAGSERIGFILVLVIGTSFAVSGFIGSEYPLAAAGSVLFIGALLRLGHSLRTKSTTG